MKNLLIALVISVLAVTSLYSDDELRARYDDPSGRVSLTLSQDISVPGNPSIAARSLAFELAVEKNADLSEVAVTIDSAKGTYTAHGMEQRLGTRHLTGKSFPLSIGENGRLLEQGASSGAPELHLGPPIDRGFSVAEALADTLPVLPSGDITPGTTWSSSRSIHSLEGWAWGAGLLSSTHRITGIDRNNARTIVSVETEAAATLAPIDGEHGYSGELKRSLTWTFDATAGRMLTLSMEQETQGVCPLPQGNVEVHQLTQVELSSAS